MASIPDRQTNQFLTTLTTVYTWVGGHRQVDNQNVWGWTDGTQWSYTNWGRGQPDNNNQGTQDFVAINLGGAGLWDDGTNTQDINRGYICQHTTV